MSQLSSPSHFALLPSPFTCSSKKFLRTMRWKLGLKVLQSISVDIVLTIRSNLDVFLLGEDVVTVMTLPLNFLICVNLLQQLSVLAATHIQLRTYP